MKSYQARVIRHYEVGGPVLYLQLWHPNHIHFGYFDELPSSRDTFIVDLEQFYRGIDRMMEVVTAPAGIGSGDRVIDAGCGVGGAARWVVRRYGARVTGFDITPAQIEKATARTRDAGLSEHARFDVADCTDRWPVASRSVDAIISLESSQYFPDRRRFIRECARVLKPGKRLVTSDWLRRDGMSLDEYIRDLQPICHHWSAWSLESLASYARMFEDAGFEIEEIEDFGRHALPNAWRMGHAQTYFGFLGLQEWSESCRCLARAWESGSFVLGRICAIRR